MSTDLSAPHYVISDCYLLILNNFSAKGLSSVTKCERKLQTGQDEQGNCSDTSGYSFMLAWIKTGILSTRCVVRNICSKNCTRVKKDNTIALQICDTNYMFQPTMAIFREMVNVGRWNDQLCYRYAVVMLQEIFWAECVIIVLERRNEFRVFVSIVIRNT